MLYHSCTPLKKMVKLKVELKGRPCRKSVKKVFLARTLFGEIGAQQKQKPFKVFPLQEILKS